MFISSIPLGPIQFQTFNFIGLVAFLFGSFVFWKIARTEHYEEIEIFDLTLLSVFWGVLGARLLYVMLHFDDFGLNIFYWISFWSKPGLYWGGLYLGGLGMFIKFCQEHKWDVYKTLDLAVIGLSLSQAVVNLGLFLSGAGAGRVTYLPIGVVFPGSFEPRYPIALFAALLWLGMFLFLNWVEGKYRKFEWYQRFKGDSKPGFLVFVYLIALGFIGLILSLLSEPEYVFYGVNMDLALRISIMLTGILGLVGRSGFGTRLNLDEIFFLKRLKK